MAWKKVSAIVTAALNKYPTTLEQDKKLLSDDSTLTYNIKNCVLFRVGEKKILHYLKDTADILIGMEKMNKNDGLK